MLLVCLFYLIKGFNLTCHKFNEAVNFNGNMKSLIEIAAVNASRQSPSFNLLHFISHPLLAKFNLCHFNCQLSCVSHYEKRLSYSLFFLLSFTLDPAERALNISFSSLQLHRFLSLVKQFSFLQNNCTMIKHHLGDVLATLSGDRGNNKRTTLSCDLFHSIINHCYPSTSLSLYTFPLLFFSTAGFTFDNFPQKIVPHFYNVIVN